MLSTVFLGPFLLLLTAILSGSAVDDWSPQRERRAASARSEEGGWASHLYWLQREEMGQDGLGHERGEREYGWPRGYSVCVGRSGVGVGN
jgi:hypothetical protein